MNDEEIDSEWTDRYRELENDYKDYYKEEVRSVNLYIIYVNKVNEIAFVKKDKILLDEGKIKQELLIGIIKSNKKNEYKLKEILKYNLTIEPEAVEILLLKKNEYNYLTPIKQIDTIIYNKTICIFQDINALYLIFKEKSNCNETKKIIILNSKKNKTRRKKIQ